MGKIIGIATRTTLKTPMNICDTATVLFDKGVGNDARGLIKGNRQVTVMSAEAWETTCAELNQKMAWTTRRANILLAGIELENTQGKVLKLGTCLLEITGEMPPCNRMDEQFEGLTKALTPHWRGGAICKIIEEGIINTNDEAVLLEQLT